MAITINHDTNDISATNGNVTIQGSAISGGGGASTLNDLTNVNAPSPSDGQALVWNASTSEWQAQTVSGGGGGGEGITTGKAIAMAMVFG